MKIKCPDCGLEISSNINKCPDCGCIFKEQKKNNYNKSKKLISLIFIIFIIIIIVISLIFIMKKVFNNNNQNNKKNYQVKEICFKGNYISNITISDVINQFSCQKFASFLIDNDIKLTEEHYNQLINLSNKDVYKVIYNYSHEDISNYYDKKIDDIAYYEYLIETNRFSLIDSKTYSDYLSRSIDDNNFNLFSVLLKGNDSLDKKYTWDGEDYYFGSLFKSEYANTDKMAVDTIRKIAKEQNNFAKEYYSYPYNDQIGFIVVFDKELFEKAYSNNFSVTLESLGSLISYLALNEIKNYVSFGGKFYKDSNEDFENMIKTMLSSPNMKDGGFVEKIDYIISEAKREGYVIEYSNLLDYFINKTSLSQMSSFTKSDLNSEIYKMLVRQGYECYGTCQLTNYY